MKYKIGLLLLSGLLLTSCSQNEKVVDTAEDEVKEVQTLDDIYYNSIYLPLETIYSEFANAIHKMDNAISSAISSDNNADMESARDEYSEKVKELQEKLNSIKAIEGMTESQITKLDDLKSNLSSSIEHDYDARMKISEAVVNGEDLEPVLIEVESHYDTSDKNMRNYFILKEELHGDYNFVRLPNDVYKLQDEYIDVVEPTEEEINIYHYYMDTAILIYSQIEEKYSDENLNDDIALEKQAEIELAEEFIANTTIEEFGITEERLIEIINTVEAYEKFGN